VRRLWLINHQWSATVASESIIWERDHDSTMTSEDSDSDFDEYNYGGLDKAWWEENAKDLNDLENGTKRLSNG